MSLMCKKCVGCQMKEGLCIHEWMIMGITVLAGFGLATAFFMFHWL